MKCGYCGKDLFQKESPKLENKPDLVISQFIYDNCEHELVMTGDDKLNLLTNLEQKKALVDNQIRSIEKLEAYLLTKKEAFASQLKEFCETNKSFLLNCEKVSIDFESNFAKLSKIKVDPTCKEKIRENLQEYFNKDDLVAWAKNCQKDSAKLLKKLSVLEEALSKDFEEIVFKQLTHIQQITQPFKSKLNLHEITFKAIEKEKDKLGVMPLDEERLEALETLHDIYSNLHLQAQNTIRLIVADVSKVTKKAEAIITRNKYLITNNVTDIINDSKILATFEDFEDIFFKCIEEIKLRAKFGFIYKWILKLLNDLTKIENGRRASFMHKFSSKIPSQIFPNIRKLSKEINIEKFFEGLEDELPIEQNLCQKLVDDLMSIQQRVFAL